MDVFEIYPREVNPVLFEEAYLLHRAAGETYRQQNKPAPPGRSPEQTAQRNGILKIASQLMILERNKLLDRFCTDWLRFRSLPIPPTEHGTPSSVDSERAARPDGVVQGTLRSNEVGA